LTAVTRNGEQGCRYRDRVPDGHWVHIYLSEFRVCHLKIAIRPAFWLPVDG
jgi:hypothetical protein